MMKKFFYSVLAAATMLLATTSCSEEEEMLGGGTVENGTTQKVTFKVGMPDESVASRVIANGVTVGGGNKANTLIWALYEKDKKDANNNPIKLDCGLVQGEKNVETGKHEFTAEISMVKGLTYNVLFFAYDNSNCAFQLATTPAETNLTALTLKKDNDGKFNLLANQEGYDAFVKCQKHTASGSGVPTEVTLTRPFAQVNVATTEDDLDKANKLQAVVTKSDMVIKQVPTQYNVLTGAATEKADLTYAASDILKHYVATGETEPTHPNEDITVNNESYKYLTMAYVLAGETATSDASTHDVTFKFYRGANGDDCMRTINIGHLPIQRNYRTNVIGDILTEEESFKIVIDERFKNDHNINPDGEWPIDETGLKYFLSNAEDGDVIKLAGDIALTEALNIPEGLELTLDLNGKKLSNENGYVLENKGNLIIDGNGTFEGLGIIRSTKGKLTVNSGNFYASSKWQESTYQHTLKAENTEVVINGGNFDATENGQTNAVLNASTGATITINGGNFKNVDGALGNYDPYLFTYEDGGHLIINDGTFYGGWRFNYDADTDIYGGNFTVGFDGQSFQSGNPHTLTVYGGTFANNTKLANKLNDVVADGYQVAQNVDSFTVLPGEGGVIPNTTISLEKAATPQDGGYIYLNSAEDFKKLSQLNTLLDNFSNSRASNDFYYRWAWKIVLNCDVDLNNEPWTPMNLGEFGGFDGQGHTIRNLKIDGQKQAALFANTYNNDKGICPIENLVIDGANVSGTEVVAVVVGWSVGTISNVTVKNATVNGAKYVGGIVGKSNSSITGCTVDNSTIKASDKEVGGIVGFLTVENQNESKTAEIANCIVTSTTSVSGGDEVGGIAGRLYAMYNNKIELKDNTADANVTATAETDYVGNIFGRDYDGTGVSINGTAIVSVATQDALNATTSNSSDNVAVNLAAGNYAMPSVSDKTFTIEGTKDVVITVDKPAFYGTDLTLKGVTVKGSGYATGVQHVNTVTYDKAKIVGEMCLYGEKVVFNGCEFDLAANQYIWTYGAKEVEFNGCTFNTVGKAILIYKDGGLINNKVTVKGCTFNATAGGKAGNITNQNCAAIEIDNSQSSIELTAESNTFDSDFSGEWRIKKYVDGNSITVNGTAYTTLALDGKTMTISGTEVTVQE